MSRLRPFTETRSAAAAYAGVSREIKANSIDSAFENHASAFEHHTAAAFGGGGQA